MARILTIGSALQDIFLIDHRDLTPTKLGEEAVFGNILVGSKVDIDRISYEVGGGGINSAITFKRNGHEVFFAGNIGNDPAGNAILKTLTHEQVNVDYVQTFNRKSTGTSIILLDDKSGERTILTCRGVSGEFENLNPEILEEIRPDWLYVTTLRGDFETLIAFFKRACKLGIKIMFNPGGRELIKKNTLLESLKYVEVLLVNRTEATQIVSGVVVKELLYQLEKLVPTVLITDGRSGGGAAAGKERYAFELYEYTKARDATGAGDAFGSGFLAARLNGATFKESLVFASANSTAVVQKIGANRGILTKDAKLHEMPIKKI